MKTSDKIYIAVSDWLIRLLNDNKRLLCLLFVCNLTYFVNLYMIIEFRGFYQSDFKFFFSPLLYLLFEIFCMIAILDRLPKIFTKLVVALTLIFFCVDTFTLAMYRSVFDKGMFQILLDTNFQEVAEYIGDYSVVFSTKIFWAVPLAIFLVLLIKILVGFIDLILFCRVRFLRCFSILVAIFLAGISTLAGLKFFLMQNPVSIIRITCLIPRAVEEIREYREVYKNFDSVKIQLTRNESELPFVIFILGESTNRDHMKIYGYDKMTTPNLQRRLDKNDLILFSDCISGATETMPVCQRLFTFYDNRAAADKAWYQYTNLFDILKAAGYHTAWLSNQEVTGIYGNVPHAYADRCDEKKFTTLHDTETMVYEFDEKILPLLDESLKKNSAAKNFYVLHLLGTHLNYRARYPAEFDIFKAEDEPAEEKFQREFQAAYDNAVLYNDFIVEEIIKRFEDKNALVIYVSDHGENVFADGKFLGHGPIGDKWQFEIPMVVWLSESCKKNHPDLAPKISAAKDLPFMTDDMIHALLDLLKIETEDFDSRRSLFSEDFDSTRKRIYKNLEYINGELIPTGS